VTLAALESGRRLALANKESLIAGAPVVQPARRTEGALLVPIDSEHCAIHQCLARSGDAELARLLITASGGPFRGRQRDELASISVTEALAHPTWQMGPKITVDSSTLMNKGLEVIEAHELFFVPYERIDVVVHPQSIVHSMVELVDGSTIAQLSLPDMRLPIGYALCYPERLSIPFGAIDWATTTSLTFEQPDRATFACLDLAYEAGRAGGGAPAWLNAANEVAVAAFLEERLKWLDIAAVVAETLGSGTGARCDRSTTCSPLTPPPGAARPRRWPGARGRDDALFAGRPGNVGVLVTTLATPEAAPEAAPTPSARRARGRSSGCLAPSR